MDCKRQAVCAVLFAIVLLNTVQLSLGMRCYQCQYVNGRGDRECLNNPPPSRLLVECNQPQCWKKYSHYNGQHNVQRFCTAVASEESYCRQSYFEDIMTGDSYPATECLCRTEGCNGSTRSPKYTSLSLLLSLLLAGGIIMFS